MSKRKSHREKKNATSHAAWVERKKQRNKDARNKDINAS